MIRGCRKKLVICMLVGFGWSAAAPGETLPWALLPLPGVVELENGVPVRGMQLDALHLLEDRLPDVQSTYRAANYRRLQRDMAQGMDFCAAPFFRRADTDRIGYFVPFTVSSPIQLVIRRADLQRFPLQDERISLRTLLQDSKLAGGLSTSRTYPEELRELLHQGLESGRLEWVAGATGGENLPLMVSVGRLDYSFEFSTMVNAMSADPRLHEPLVSVPLDESLALVESGIYCTRSEWGLRMAGRLDQAIRELSRQPQTLLELYRRYMPASTYRMYSEKIAAYYQVRADLPPLLPQKLPSTSEK